MSVNKKAKKHAERVRYWSEVMSRAAQYSGSDYLFCTSECITKSPFYNWKKKLSKGESPASTLVPAPFTEVEVTSSKVDNDLKLSSQGVIDARWVADLILHLHGGLR